MQGTALGIWRRPSQQEGGEGGGAPRYVTGRSGGDQRVAPGTNPGRRRSETGPIPYISGYPPWKLSAEGVAPLTVLWRNASWVWLTPSPSRRPPWPRWTHCDAPPQPSPLPTVVCLQMPRNGLDCFSVGNDFLRRFRAFYSMTGLPATAGLRSSAFRAFCWARRD